MRLFVNQPLFVNLLGISSVAMYVPMLYAARIRHWEEARVFFYHATFFLIVTVLIALALRNQAVGNRIASRLVDIAAAFFILPAFMAFPVDYLVPQINFGGAYFEMLSSFTTTGATLFDEPTSVADVIHLWRALVAWLGGYLMLVVAIAIFKHMHIGGFEVFAIEQTNLKDNSRNERADVRQRTIRTAISIFPVYTISTSVLAILLIMLGDRPLVALIHAMSTISTSGISSLDGMNETQSGIFGELVIFAFLFFAVTRLFMLRDRNFTDRRKIERDKELNLALICVVVLPLLLFLRHWIAAQEFPEDMDWVAGLRSLWGSFFTVLSFLTTTGFESSAWGTAQDWSGLSNSGLLLMALATIGGGIATTAGGVKLLRVYALYKHGTREMNRLTFPNSVGGAGPTARQIRRQGAYTAWIFLMLFLVSIAVTMLLLASSGTGFEESLILSVASLSNTGPLLNVAGDVGLSYASLTATERGILCCAMVLGRLEALAVIVIFNPMYWRK